MVRAGTVLGFFGESGRTTGSHLHFEVRVRGRSVNPLAVLVGLRGDAPFKDR